jgi:hypothetical protein
MTSPLEQADHEPGHGRVRAEEDRVDSRTIVAVGLGSLVLFLLAGAAAVGYLRMRQGEHPPLVIPPEIGQSKIGMIEQDQFDVAVRGEDDRARRRERLESYGWVDREKGIVHLPIERAMELVAQGVRPAPGPGAPPVTPGAQP